MPDFWQFPTVSMGLGADDGDLPGALHALPGEPRPRASPRTRRCGRSSATGRWTSRSRWARSPCRCARGSTTSSSSSTATCSASTARCAATARSSRSSSRPSSAPAGTSSRCCGARAGIRCWRAITKGLLRRVMEESVDGEYQNFKAKGGAYTREHFFGKYPELKAMVANMSDEEIWRLNRGGHDPRKVYAAYAAAMSAQGPADGDPRQDRQGLWARQGGRGADDRPPAEEALGGGSAASSATASTSRSRMRTSRACRSAGPTRAPRRRAT